MEERSYYIYRHLRAGTRMPFYIGLGRKKKRFKSIKTEYARAYSKDGRNSHWHNIYKKHGVIVQILIENLTEEEAIAKEKEFIALYGRVDQGTGILCNWTDGGEGLNRKKLSPEAIESIRKAATGRPKTKENIERQRKISKELFSVDVKCVETGKVFIEVGKRFRRTCFS